MATVTKKFRDDFETWAGHRLASGDWTETEMQEFKGMLRKDLAPGPDQLRAGISTAAGSITKPAAIDDHEERYRLWADYFSAEASEIKNGSTGYEIC